MSTSGSVGDGAGGDGAGGAGAGGDGAGGDGAGGDGAGGLRLVLARHGQTPANVDRILDTRLPGPGLTDLGRAQADALGAELASDRASPVTAVYHSPARRAAETAALVCARLARVPRRLDGVQEVQVGDLEGRNDEPALEEFRTVFDAWLAGDLDRPQPGGESAREVLARFLPAIDRLRADHTGGTVVLVSHGAALRLTAPILLDGVGTPEPGEDHIGNCGRVVLRAIGGMLDRAGWQLETWRGDVPGGLPATHDPTG